MISESSDVINVDNGSAGVSGSSGSQIKLTDKKDGGY